MDGMSSLDYSYTLAQHEIGTGSQKIANRAADESSPMRFNLSWGSPGIAKPSALYARADHQVQRGELPGFRLQDSWPWPYGAEIYQVWHSPPQTAVGREGRLRPLLSAAGLTRGAAQRKWIQLFEQLG